jgi:hypothetical protein
MNNTIALPTTCAALFEYLEMFPPGQPTVADESKAAVISAGVKFAEWRKKFLQSKMLQML